MNIFKPGGYGHLCLARVAETPAPSKSDVRRALGLSRAKQNKANRLLDNLRAAGLVSRRADGFGLTILGQEVLGDLRAGLRVEIEIGVFERAA